MPIRIEPDQPQPNRDRRPSQDDRPSGGIPSWLKLIPFLLIFVRKPGKWIIILAVIFGLYYLWQNMGSYTEDSEEQAVSDFEYQTQRGEELTLGANFNQAQYDLTLANEPLAVGYGSSLPSSANLETYAPRRLNQGYQGSCSGWAIAYAARTISYARATGQSPNAVAFSPSFLYNQVALPGCQGAYMHEAMAVLRDVGSLPFKDFGYTDESCRLQPEPYDQRNAAQYRIKGYDRLTLDADDYTPDLQGIKQYLAQGAPVVIGMMVGPSFQQNMMGKRIWNPTRQDYTGQGLGGHAMCVVGYDDQMEGGAFRIMNSWGERWGERGFTWVRYDDFQNFTKEAYGIYPESPVKPVSPNTPSKPDNDIMAAEFGLVDPTTKSFIPLKQIDEVVFRTASPVAKGKRFKIAITNSVECYIYVLGKESDGSSYVLFPYTDKHSPYCGITGTRVFPREESLVADQIGNRDQMAIIISKKPLDYNAINARISSQPRTSYLDRMISVLQDQFVPACDFKVGNTISFECETGDRNVLGMIIEVDKR